MIIDLNEVENDPFQNTNFDICICGGGVAGITLALNLSKKFNVALLEASGFEYSQDSQDVYGGRNIGHAYYDTLCRGYGILVEPQIVGMAGVVLWILTILNQRIM